MKKRIFVFAGVAAITAFTLASCGSKGTTTTTTEAANTTTDAVTTTTAALAKSYDFIIYEPDSDNTNLSDNKVVATYHIEYTDATYVSDTLIKKDKGYYFSNDSEDYLVLENSAYGLSYTQGYFANYSACANNTVIDVSWSRTSVNGTDAMTGIGTTPLEGLNVYGFVIDGWK